MTDILWIAVGVQILMGAFDTLYHHEGTERLAWRPSQRLELILHGVRNLAYGVMFVTLGWFEPHGFWASALLALLAGELIITLWDFVEEDRTRHLPATERITHTLLTLNYGVVLALLVPWLYGLTAEQRMLVPAFHGVLSWLAGIAALAVTIAGIRDLAAAKRTARLRDAAPASLAYGLPPRQSILITGGTGFIGSRLVAALAADGHEVTVLTRDKAKVLLLAIAGPVRCVTSLDHIASDARIDTIINLAGEPISDTPWTKAKRVRIVRSRLAATYALMRLIDRLDHKPATLVSGSAIGWYGLRGDELLTEANEGTPCFSRRVCVSWERAAKRAERRGVRTVLLRTGLVLDRSGGMLSRLLAPFEFGLGGRFGDGRHWMSWIHRDDLVRLIVHVVANDKLSGPVNGVAPEAVNNRQFTAALAAALGRPALIPVPAAPLRLALGAFGEELLLSGQRIAPDVALKSGFTFTYPTLDKAFAQIVGRRDPGISTGVPTRVAATVPA